MTEPTPPPLPDMDWTAATEAAAQVLRRQYEMEYDIPAWDRLDRFQRDALLDQAAEVVKAVWPILHEVAYAAGQASVLDGAEEEWGLRRIGTGKVVAGHTRQSVDVYMAAYGEHNPARYEAVRSAVIRTPWTALGGLPAVGGPT